MGAELILKAAMVPLAMLLSSLAARRFGHGVAGILAGFPLVATPVMLVLTLQLPAATLEAIVAATLIAVPANVGYLVVWAWLARRFAWWGCLAGATFAFAAAGLSIAAVAPSLLGSWPTALVFGIVLPVLSPAIGLRLMPPVPAGERDGVTAGVRIPASEIVVRMTVAFLMGMALIAGAGTVTPSLSGLMMTWPVTGTVLPAFTLALHGRAAVIVLLRGSVRGLLGFCLFFLAMRLGLAAGVPPLAAFLAGVAAPVVLAISMRRNDRNDRRAGDRPATAGPPSVPRRR